MSCLGVMGNPVLGGGVEGAEKRRTSPCQQSLENTHTAAPTRGRVVVVYGEEAGVSLFSKMALIWAFRADKEKVTMAALALCSLRLQGAISNRRGTINISVYAANFNPKPPESSPLSGQILSLSRDVSEARI